GPTTPTPRQADGNRSRERSGPATPQGGAPARRGRTDRRATARVVPRTPGRGRLCRPAEAARPDGLGRLPPPAAPPGRRRGRFSGHLPRPGPQGGDGAAARAGRQLALRGGPPNGAEGAGAGRATPGSGKAGDGDARTGRRGTGPPERPAAPA